MHDFMQQRDTIEAASEFAARNQLPKRIKDQMLSHICLRFKTQGLKPQDTFNDLPKGIRSSIAYKLFFPIVRQAYLFRGVSFNFLHQLVAGHPNLFSELSVELNLDDRIELIFLYRFLEINR